MSRVLRRPADVYIVRDGRLVLRDYYIAPQQFEMALKSKQAGGLSDRGIAEHCGAGPELVAEVRRLVFDSNTVAATTRKAKDGRVIKADSDARSKAGKASAAKKAETKAAAQTSFGATLGARIAAKATR